MPRLGSGIPLVARAAELGGLRAALDRADQGTAAGVLVSGDAGIGKTRLVEELAAQASAAGALVLTGRCLDVGESGLPYLPFAEALGQLRDERLAAVLARPALVRLLPELAIAGRLGQRPEQASASGLTSGMDLPTALGLPRTEQDVGQLQLFDAVFGLLGELAEQSCVVLLIEDLHWADASTRRLLSFLLTRLRTQRVLVVASYRTDDLHRRHPLRPLLAELVRLPIVERLELAPLSQDDACAFVRALVGDDVPDQVVRQVAAQSEGNAFFAEELIAAYSGCGPAGLPASLVDVLLARVEQFGPAAAQVVRVASAAGRQVAHADLRAVVDLDELALDEALREAVQRHVLVAGDDDVYRFRHALLREAVYGDLLPGERVRLHAGYARMLAARTASGTAPRGTAAALAHHSLESNDLGQALAASVRAAEEAKDLSAPAEYLGHLEQALRLWDAVPADQRPSDVDELELLRRASWAAGTAGDPERALAYARSAVALADRLGDPEAAADARQRLVQTLLVLEGHEAEANEITDQAWQLVADQPPSRTRARVLALQARVLRYLGGHEQSVRRAEQAVRDARAVGAVDAEVDALVTLALQAERTGEDEDAVRQLRLAVDLAVEGGALAEELRARYYLGLNAYEAGLIDKSIEIIDAGVARATDLGLSWSGFGLELRVIQAIAKYAGGDWDGAEAAAQPPGEAVSSVVLTRLAAAALYPLVGRGRFAEAEELITRLRENWQVDLTIPLIAGAAGAELACWRDDPDQAVERVGESLTWARRIGGPWVLAGIRLAALGVAACADQAVRAVRRRDTDALAAAVAEGRRLHEHARLTAANGSPRTSDLGPEGVAWLARAEAELARLLAVHGPTHQDGQAVDAARRWADAVRAFDYGARYEQAICRWRWAEALLAAERRDEAAEHLRQAAAVAAELGARPLAEAVEALAGRARIALRADQPVPRQTLDLFTPRERAVLELVALGRTNREVGEELYISEKTVSVHLTRVMAKLGASRRAEAVALAYDRGLLDTPAGPSGRVDDGPPGG
ncbi:helix-turn-helix transcriptional regulator [Goodfellowiella coeruleoviolacea]|uniref:Regulatory protein, luxR family n=1 Tax=Goodfellowiella coeruleoviolacea TaxID=334858 RepID=A0AAE3KH15_9PSEU|nr:LuxR family transcriptional regulator [Goodfellowiella coeruleoviolacea]MCP2166372.1 regulatory protein, luxR family [Goodfellowiella coeruleoviolacea]